MDEDEDTRVPQRRLRRGALSPAPSARGLARAFVALHGALGFLALLGGVLLLGKCAWHLLTGARQWSQSYFAVLFGIALVTGGLVYLRAPAWRQRYERGRGEDR